MNELEKKDLLNEVKSYLRITWNEEDPDIQKMIDRAISYFKSIAGTDVDFVDDGQNRQLLLDRCRYMRNHVIEEFEENFKSEIINLQFRLYKVAEDIIDGTI
ncbi:phage gp6-like head-tail connector protein [Psychrobacillus sp. Sa2BUA9]|uniref:Phage gp6-like head-tail connector protein n=1 Tax=Psychrobacillus faecigallinarum TaxID=2762235 RepID=A0ABR8RF51_9BACI|nr:head-tail connector protein [Psychrobacillus faecigallinarum]MBD7946411.1 phage gp6-like head-tail connector protein [Psychrobacillus faecigallinarum]